MLSSASTALPRKVASVNRLAQLNNGSEESTPATSSLSSSPSASSATAPLSVTAREGREGRSDDNYSGMKSSFAKGPSGVVINMPSSSSGGATAYGAVGSGRALIEQMKQRKGMVALAAIAAFIFFFFVVPGVFGSGPDGRRSGSGSGGSGGSNGALGLNYFPDSFRVAIIADLDKRSKSSDGKSWKSIYRTGTLKRKGASGQSYAIDWDEATDVSTGHNEAGRGAELSELVLFKNKLYTFDDRTGIMFELQNYHSSNPTSLKGKAPTLVPRGLFMEGDGSTDKGMKVEWATVKDGLMWVGSFGKEYTANDGSVLNINNLWVKVMSERGVIQHVNWEDHYNALRRVLGYDFPAYILHEAITWSPHHKRWFVLPRRVSKDAYDEQVDEKKGSNLIISCSPDFSDIQTTSVGRITPVRGFSTFKFLPGSKDSVIIAIKSEENSALDRQTAYLTIYGIDEEATARAREEGAGGGAGSGSSSGSDSHNNAAIRWKVLMEETEIPGEAKFEGLEVIEPVA